MNITFLPTKGAQVGHNPRKICAKKLFLNRVMLKKDIANRVYLVQYKKTDM